MDFDRQRLQDDLQGLAELPTAPPDPVPDVRRRVRTARRRRAVGVGLLAASAVVAVTALGGPTLGALRGDSTEPGYAGSPEVTNSVRGTPGPSAPPGPSFPLPEPWSDRALTKMPIANAYQPKAYYVNEGKVDGRDWTVWAFNDDGRSAGCLVTEPQEIFDPYVCFDDWPAGRRADWFSSVAYAGPKPNPDLLPATLVMGAVSVDARTVDIKVAGRTYHADAVGTPASNRLRFFAIVVPVVDAKPGEVVPRDANGDVADPPVGLPETGDPCENCAEVTPKPGGPKQSETLASGPGYEEYVAGKQGPGYLVNEGDGASAVSHRLNGDGAACLSAEPSATPGDARVCFGDGGQPRRDGVLWKAVPGSNDTVVVIGMLNRNSPNRRAEVLDEQGKSLGRVSAVQTPTTGQATFFMTVLPKGTKVGNVRGIR